MVVFFSDDVVFVVAGTDAKTIKHVVDDVNYFIYANEDVSNSLNSADSRKDTTSYARVMCYKIYEEIKCKMGNIA